MQVASLTATQNKTNFFGNARFSTTERSGAVGIAIRF
jgi:hypothetical protein